VRGNGKDKLADQHGVTIQSRTGTRRSNRPWTLNATKSTARRVVIFDLDGTLTESKSDLDKEMASLISELLQLMYVAVTSGCSYQQLRNQFLSRLPRNADLRNLFLFPTCSASGYYYDIRRGHFSLAYSNLLPERAVRRIVRSFEEVFTRIGYAYPRKTYGQIFENRGSQLTFSALGQKAPLRLKRKWDPNRKKRLKIARVLRTKLPDLEITIGGTTSIDVTRKGVNKTLCVKKLKEHLSLERKSMLFVGDALFRGGNDYIMKSTGVRCISVSGPKETKRLVRRMTQSIEGARLQRNDNACSRPRIRLRHRSRFGSGVFQNVHAASTLANLSRSRSKVFSVSHDL
jgi:phosphomannomutase